ncbi:hypothetical protein [Spongiactinospora sp. TRM90649]|uniref:hypothetical protein n=1 Tax=Spongiactinospora sp. TRM90649 TaxID=3031114 RepID=UPI0023F786B2|nr:hypothetical protein [Spongiactinospora sp. TRM90649]MDF5756856.1 hypothetical protein [Spongiactinospora sp. TRM90649]
MSPKPAGQPSAQVSRMARRRTGGRAPRAPFVLLLVGLLCGGLVSLLLLTTVLAQDSVEADKLRSDNKRIKLETERQRLENVKQDTAAALAERAARHGSRPDPSFNPLTSDEDLPAKEAEDPSR